jgi:hypothetical protein
MKIGAMIELLFHYKKRIAYCARVFKPAKAAKEGAFLAASGAPTKRRGGNEAGGHEALAGEKRYYFG